MTNKSLYGMLPPISAKIQVRRMRLAGHFRMRLAGHCVSHREEILNKLVLWEPTYGIADIGRRHISYIDNLMNDTGVDNIKELKTIRDDVITGKIVYSN